MGSAEIDTKKDMYGGLSLGDIQAKHCESNAIHSVQNKIGNKE